VGKKADGDKLSPFFFSLTSLEFSFGSAKFSSLTSMLLLLKITNHSETFEFWRDFNDKI